MATLDFEVEIGTLGAEGSYPVRASAAWEADGTLRWSWTPADFDRQLAAIQHDVLASSAPVRRAATEDEQPVRELGQRLFEALIADDVRVLYEDSRRRARADGGVLRLVLRVRPPELARLPWEFLFDPGRQDYLGLEVPLVRYPQVLAPTQPLRVPAPLRILGMVALPGDQRALNTGEEQRRLQAALAGLQRDGLVDLEWVAGQTYRDLEDALDSGPWHVFHFVGHGGYDRVADEGTLALADETGRTDPIGAEDISRLLAEHHPLRLVVLNACDTGRGGATDAFSSTAAALIRREVPAVVAMQFAITDPAVIWFAQSFYEHVAKRRPVDDSVRRARLALRRAKKDTLEWGTPVLYLRTPDGRIFDTTIAAPPQAAPAPDLVAPEVAEPPLTPAHQEVLDPPAPLTAEPRIVPYLNKRPTAFVVWAHREHDWSEARSQSWEKTILEFTSSLRNNGVEADVDLFHGDGTDWTRFGQLRIAASDVTIIAVSNAWRERWQGRNKANMGAGAVREIDELKGRFEHDQERFQGTVKIVILPGASEDDIPNDLRRLPRYHIRSFNLAGLEELLRALFRKPRYVPLPPGAPPDLPPVNMIGDSSGGIGASATASDELEQPSNPAAQESKLRADLAQAEDILRALPESGRGEGPDPRWYRQAWQRRDRILEMLTAFNAATETFVAQTSQPPVSDVPGRSHAASSTIPGAAPYGPTAQPPHTVTGGEGAAKAKSISELLLQVSELLAEIALREAADARVLQAKGMYREAHALLTEAVDRLRGGRLPEAGASTAGQDIHELVGSLRQIADTQRDEKLAELEEVVGRATASIAYAGDQILGELIKEVPSVVRPLSSQIEIRTLISRKQLEAIYGDLSKQAAKQLATIFKQRFEERITPDVSAALQAISVLPRQFQEALDEHLLDAVPAIYQSSPATWAVIAPTFQLEARLSTEGARLVDLSKIEHELLIDEFKAEVARITGKVVFNNAFGVLLSAALKLLWVMFRDDPLSTISKERRVRVLKRRLVTALQHALDGDDVRSEVSVASRGIETELRRHSAAVRCYVEEATADIVRRADQHLSTVHQVLDRAAVQLDQIAARF